MGDIITLMIVFLTIIAVVGFAVYYMKQRGNGVNINFGGVDISKKENEVGDIRKRELSKSKLQQYFEISELDDEILRLTNKNGYRVILSISSPDFALLNNDEKEIFENSLLDLGLALNFPIQFFTTTTKVETKKAAEKVNTVINSDDDETHEKLKQYSRMLHDRLINLENARDVYVRKSYCVIGIDDIYDKKRALSELRNRVETVRGALLNAKMRVSVLEKDKVAQLFANVLNKGANISIDELKEKDVLSTFSIGNQ